MATYKVIKHGVEFEIRTSEDGYIPPKNRGELAPEPEPVVRRKTADELDIESLEVSNLNVSGVDSWVDANVRTLDDVRATLKQVIKLVCKKQTSALLKD